MECRRVPVLAANAERRVVRTFEEFDTGCRKAVRNKVRKGLFGLEGRQGISSKTQGGCLLSGKKFCIALGMSRDGEEKSAYNKNKMLHGVSHLQESIHPLGRTIRS